MRAFVLLSLFASAVLAMPEPRQDPDLTQVKFFLYTRENPETPDDVPFDFDDLSWTNYDGSKNTYIMMHGWNSGIRWAEPFIPG